MRPLRNLLAGSAALVGLSLCVTACDASPYAAVVNKQVIKQTALNAELRTWAGNSAYVSAFNSSNSSSGLTVAGDAPNTYRAAWVANILDGMIRAVIVNQDLTSTGQLPSNATVNAARSVGEISQVGWYQFSAGFRDTLVGRIAEAATLQVPVVSSQTLEEAYRQYQHFFFIQICTVQASAFNTAEAETLVANGVSNGAPVCYDQAQLENQPEALRTAVMGGAVGAVLKPVPSSYGYTVVKVTSRQDQGFNQQVQNVLASAIDQAQGVTEPALAALLAKSSVKINPAYGTWSSNQVTPRALPGASSSPSQ